MMTEDAKPPILVQETALLNDDDGQALGGSHVIEKDVKPPPFVQKIVKEEKAPLNDDDGFGLEEEKPGRSCDFISDLLFFFFVIKLIFSFVFS